MNKSRTGSQPAPKEWRPRESRRRFLQQLGALGAGSLAAEFLPGTLRAASAISPRNAAAGSLPIKHVIIAGQENRSFDHYFGFAPFVGSFGVPAGYSQPDGL